MRGTALALLLALAALARAAEAPVALVETAPLKRLALADTVSGYGTVAPQTRSVTTVSLPRPGRIATLFVAAGQVVKKGEPLLEFATGADATRGFEQARQAVEFARGEKSRIEQLVTQQLATRSQLAAAEKSLADAEAALQAQERIGAGRPLERIGAPFDGVVVSLAAAQGDRVAAGAPALKLARAGGQRLVVGIEPEDVRRVRPGMAATVTPVFQPSRVAHGRVAQVFGMLNPQTQFVDVVVEIDGDGLMPGTRARGRIELERREVWTVPRSAVLRDAQGAYLFQVRDGRARRIAVRTGLERDGVVEVDGPFDPREPVVSLGNYELEDGMRLRTGGR
ncbi:MAG TPA: efflux RND transporter periplasmic adaptor subunit [Burkholderiales bacterium]|nr:efflux RND transporter periplasmic adaptor subunit [Burkholderiales bacterium]